MYVCICFPSLPFLEALHCLAIRICSVPLGRCNSLVEDQMAAQDPTLSIENNGFPLLVTAVTFLVLTWTSVLLRTYVRAFMLNGFQSDDWLMLIGQVKTTNLPLSPCCWDADKGTI